MRAARARRRAAAPRGPAGRARWRRRLGERERFAQRAAGLGGAAGAADRRAELGQRARLLDPGAAPGEGLDGRAQALDGRVAAFEQAGRAAGDADRARRAEALRERQLVRDQLARLLVPSEPLRGQAGLRAPRQHGRIDRQELAKVPAALKERLQRLAVLAAMRGERAIAV